MVNPPKDLICAIASPPGRGGVGIIRLSGDGIEPIAQRLFSKPLRSRTAEYVALKHAEEVVDTGIALFFQGPNSFTGEDTLEFQGHGSPVVQQRILSLLGDLGVRMARPGEFSERAFLNGKMDLTQAEAVADLIASGSIAAAKAAMGSLTGAFSQRVEKVATQLLDLRMQVEAAIDFPEEEVDILAESQVTTRLATLQDTLQQLFDKAEQGRLLNGGIEVALIGAPNVGKSSLLNALSGDDTAIITDQPGTTRDLLKVDLNIGGLPIRLVDTAGLRDTEDQVDTIGIERAKAQAMRADLVLFISSVEQPLAAAKHDLDVLRAEYQIEVGENPDALTAAPLAKVIMVRNKSDLLTEPEANLEADLEGELVAVSATQMTGIKTLTQKIHTSVGLVHSEPPFTARVRHIRLLASCSESLRSGQQCLQQGQPVEIVAEELRLAHESLGQIVGTVTADDLLGEIFSKFCIGK